MPSTAAIEGNDLELYIGGTLVGCSRDASISLSRAFIDATCKDNDGAEQVLPGQTSWNASGSAIYAMDATLGGDEMIDNLQNGTLVTVRMTTGVTGDTYLEGSAYVENLNFTSNYNDVVTYDFSLKGTGTLTKGTEA